MSDRPTPLLDNPVAVDRITTTPSQSPEGNTASKDTGNLHSFSIKDKHGNPFSVDYFTFDGEDALPLLDQRVGNAFGDIMRIAKKCFPAYGEAGFDNVVKKLGSAKSLDIIKTPDKKVVGFHVYSILDLPVENGTAKVLNTEYAAIDPDYQGKGLTTQGRLPVLDLENPDIVCGSTGNPAIYIANERVANERGLILYPNTAETPEHILAIARSIHEQLGNDEKSDLDDRLVLSYKGPASKGERSHPFFKDVLALKENQHVFYMAVKPEIDNH